MQIKFALSQTHLTRVLDMPVNEVAKLSKVFQWRK